MVWFMNPGRDALYAVLRRLLTPYVENLDLNKFQAGLWAGQFSVNNLTLKKSALDKFRLPIDVIEGHLGHLTLNIPWATLTSRPAEIVIEDLYLLAIPAAESKVDLEEDEARAQASKQERLKNAEVLRASGKDLNADDDQRSQGVFESLIGKIVNNVQITVKNIHIRYEDKLSVPGHPFAVGVTLAEFTAVSTDDTWEAAFIQSTSGAVRKLASLDSLAVYFNTDAESITESPDLLETFRDAISQTGRDLPDHQFILKPVTSEGRITINHRGNEKVPKINAELQFDEIGFVLDDSQYRDAISMVDMYHFYLRQYQYRKFRPPEAEIEANRPRAMLKFATDAIRTEVHERRRRWTWEFFAERRDARNRYVELFKRRESIPALSPPDQAEFDTLERNLPYEDIRFYRSIGRSQLRKERANQKKLEAEQAKNAPPKQQGWIAWAWGSGSAPANEGDSSQTGSDGMTDEQRQELYRAIDYDEADDVAAGLSPPRDLMKARIYAQLRKGSLSLRRSSSSGSGSRRQATEAEDVISLIFDDFNADVIQRPDNLDATLTLGGMHVHDGTTPDTRYPEIIRMKGTRGSTSRSSRAVSPTSSEGIVQSTGFSPNEPFFFVKFEHNPLDERADNALTVRMKAMEVIYHRGYLEAIYSFLKPPESQLESVAALINAANQTIEGLRSQTRAGFEYALQNHKTVDIKLDMAAPIIIIPEDVKAPRCNHLVLDAGHISIESKLADQDAIREVQGKKNQSYSSADFERLESLMYDNFSVRLNDAQLVIGENIDELLSALSPDRATDAVHLLERIDMDFTLQMSIVADALNLTRFKVAGRLPTLAVNISNSKYNGLMRIINAAIPNFDGAEEKPRPAMVKASKSQREGMQEQQSRPANLISLPSNLFASAEPQEYTVEEDGQERDSKTKENDQAKLAKIQQKTFEFSFQVGTLRATLSKTDTSGTEALLAQAILEHFTLDFSLATYEMLVDIMLRSVALNMVDSTEGSATTLPLLKSDTRRDEQEALVQIHYLRVNPASPDFVSKYDSIDQNIDIGLSTFVFSASPRPVIALYDFLMVTFVSGNDAATSGVNTPVTESPLGEESPIDGSALAIPEPQPASGKISLKLGLSGVTLILLDGTSKIATLDLSTANITLMLANNTMHIGVQLGNLSLVDESSLPTSSPEYKQLVTIEGSDLLDLTYETFDAETRSAPGGVNSAVTLRTGSMKVHFLERPFHDLYEFMIKFARLKSLYDSATQAAVQRASEIQRMKFDVSIQSPVIIFPDQSLDSNQQLVLRLGEVAAKNEYSETFTKTTAGLTGISLTSNVTVGKGLVTLSIVDRVDINADILQHDEVEVTTSKPSPPESEIHVLMTDVKMSLTQKQYVSLMGLLQAIPRVFALEAEEEVLPIDGSTVSTPLVTDDKQPLSDEEATNLAPELRPVVPDGTKSTRSKLDLIFQVKGIRLNIYNSHAVRDADFKDTGIARFALNDNTVRVKMLADGALEAEVVLQTFTMTNTRPGRSRFREVIPAEKNREQAQVMILYTSSGTGAPPSSLAIVTVDSPKILFALDPAFALLSFFTSAFLASPTPADDVGTIQTAFETSAAPPANPSASALSFRFDLHDASITVLEDDEQANSQALRLSIQHVSLSQQSILALTINKLGMSLVTMQSNAGVRLLDDLDITLSLDSRQTADHQMTSLELGMRPVILRASLIDINLITSIVLRAASLYGEQNKTASTSSSLGSSTRPSGLSVQSPSRPRPRSGRHSRTRSSMDKPQVHLSKEKLKAHFDGFRFVLIGSRYQLPVLHTSLDAFDIDISDWSSELKAQSSLGVTINYWNLLNSHWEPLIDPWAFSLQLANTPGPNSGLAVTLSSKERLDLNVTSTFIEAALNLSAMLGEVGGAPQRIDRVDDAPYKLRNRTGIDLIVWHDRDNSSRNTHEQGVKLASDALIDWRFDDSKTMRERLSASRNNTLRLQLHGTPYEPLRSIPVDREGEYVYVLRPRKDAVSDRLLVEVRVKDNIKIVTIRSTYLVQNRTLYPLELVMVDASGKPALPLQKIAPGNDYAVPLDLVTRCKLRIRPDSGFGFNWSGDALGWEDLVRSPELTIGCRSKDGSEAPFRFQASAVYDRQDPTARKYPKINLILRAPIEIENLLPFDLNYRVFDKNTNQNWASYLRKGGVMPVHSVRLDHLVLLNVDVNDTGFKPSEFAIINTDNTAEFETEKKLTLTDREGRQLNLRLNYYKYPDSGGAFKVQIYSPFILVNHTGLPFTLRSGNTKLVANLNNPNVKLHTPTPFMFSHSSSGGNEFSFRIRDSSWSKAISFEAPNAETEVVLDVPEQNQQILVGVSWTLGLGKYKICKVITLAPRFIIVNNLPRKLCFREHGVPPPTNSNLEPGAQTSLMLMRPRDEKLITVTYPGLNAQWSAPLSVQEVGNMHVRVYPPGESGSSTATPDLVKVTTAVESATVFVYFELEKGPWPFRIENDSDFSFGLSQSDDRLIEEEARGGVKQRPRYSVERHSSFQYAWDYPSSPNKKLRLHSGDDSRDIDILEIGNLIPFKFRTQRGAFVVSLDVRVENGAQTLSISNYVEEFSLYKPKLRRQSTVSRNDTLTGLEAFETVAAEEIQASLTFTLDLEGVGLSLINKRAVELLYLSSTGIKIEYMDSVAAQTINVALQSIQLDNQLHDALFPVVLQPTPLPKNDRGALTNLPAVQASVMVLKDDSHGVVFIKYASILLQALTVRVDEDFLFALLDFSKVQGASWEEETPDVLIAHPEGVPRAEAVAGGQELYFEVLELQPIQLSMSFERTERVNADEKVVIRNPVAVVINALTMALGNVNEAPLQLNALGIKDARMSTAIIQDRIFFHYRQEVLRQLYRILGSADFLGNPVGLFTNVSSGIADVFYEPYKGVVMHGNKELGIGIAKGAASLVKKTVFGFSDSVTKVTSSIGKGLSSATFDSEFQRQRRLAQRQNKPKHAIYGVAAGAEALATSFQSGIEGVVMKPIEGAESGGAFGFFKGVGKGIVGAVAKPMVGVFDLAANVSEGIRNTTTVFDGPQRDRVRIPRHIPYDGILTAYSQREALGQRWLKDLDAGRFRDEPYVAHLELPGRDTAIMLTTSHILSIWCTKLRVEWDMPFNQLQGVTVEDTGIRFSHKAGRESDHFVVVPKESKMWFFKEIEKVVVRYNAKRRVER